MGVDKEGDMKPSWREMQFFLFIAVPNVLSFIVGGGSQSNFMMKLIYVIIAVKWHIFVAYENNISLFSPPNIDLVISPWAAASFN